LRNEIILIIPLFVFSVAGCAAETRNASKPPNVATTSIGSRATLSDSAEIQSLYEQDQADRDGNVIDGAATYQRDAKRRARMRELLDAGAVRTSGDHYHAALVFQHADDIEGIQLAHELAMIAMALGHREARWLAAASYDRLMMDLGRYQRFGTQYQGGNDGMMQLVPVDQPGVTDAMRAALDCPALHDAQGR